jgi:RHS repeat-associated protein
VTVNTTNAYTAIAQDSYGRQATNTATVSLSTSLTYQYDSNGNLTNDGLRSFAYDDENQLIQVWVPGQWFSQFTYDGKMRRRIRQEYAWQGSAWVQTNAIYYAYDGNLVLQERTAANLPSITFTRGKNLSGSLDGAGGIGGLLSMTLNATAGGLSANSLFYHCDGNGNVTMLLNPSQAIVGKYLYDAFGNTLSLSGSMANANLYRFSSKEWHPNSGLAYYLYRYYDPNLQRWANRDPLGDSVALLNLYSRVAQLSPSFASKTHGPLPWEFRGGPNLYEMVHNSPVDMVDTDGRGAFPHYPPGPSPLPPDQRPPGKFGNVCPPPGPPGCSKTSCRLAVALLDALLVELFPPDAILIAAAGAASIEACDKCPNP